MRGPARKLERELLDLAGQWEDKANRIYGELPRGISSEVITGFVAQQVELQRCARQLRELVQSAPSESVREVLTAYASEGV